MSSNLLTLWVCQVLESILIFLCPCNMMLNVSSSFQVPVSAPASVPPYAIPVCSGPHHIPVCTTAHIPGCTSQPTWSIPACSMQIPCSIQHLPPCGFTQLPVGHHTIPPMLHPHHHPTTHPMQAHHHPHQPLHHQHHHMTPTTQLLTSQTHQVQVSPFSIYSLIKPPTSTDNIFCTHFHKDRSRCKNIWRKVVHVNYLYNVSSNFFQNMSSTIQWHHTGADE
jgi:hypothetical protein